jgi:mutator protein MutT
VETGGMRLFHAGDLNNWYARFLTDDYQGGLVYSPDFGVDIDPAREEKRFLGELKDVRKLAGRFDVVMFPVDGRIGNGYTRGARQFLDRFQVGLFVPMHFVASGFESAWRMKEFADAKSVPFWSIAGEGESREVRKRIEVVAAVMSRDGKYFATQRGYGEFKDYWEFPGGKMEPGESREEALMREIREELDTDIRVDAFLTTVECDYPSFHLTMHCYLCTVVSGSLVLKEHESAAWLGADELDRVAWLPADVEVVKEIKKRGA